MNTYYSVIFASVNSIISEQLSVGLILVSDSCIRFRYSRTKLLLMKQFFSDESFNLLRTSLKNIERSVESFNVKSAKEKNSLFKVVGKDNHAFSLEYLYYLSRYSNSIMTFKEPVRMDIEASDNLFTKLYTDFIFEEAEEVKKVAVVDAVKTKLYPRIKNHVNWEQRIETGQIPGLIIPIDLDFIGKNEKAVIGKVTDFDQPNYNLDASLSNIFVLMKTLEINRETGNYFIVGNEPKRQKIKQHKTWNEIRNSRFLEFVPFSETDRIAEYMEEHDVRPYFDVISE